MNEKCFTRNPLERDGTSQGQRLLETLLPAYVGVDERSMKDLAEFAAKFAAEIVFHEPNTATPGDWTDFFKLTDNWEIFSLEEYLANLKIDQETKPHLALFFGFLYLFKVAQDDINSITQRHLDFYYRDVLQLEENPAVSDQVAIIFNLAKHVDSHLIKKGTLLKAGKDDTGVDLLYEVERDVAVNKTTVSDLKAVFVGKVKEEDKNQVFASPEAKSSDGKGGKIENEEKSWKTFGKPEDDERDLASLGFAFAAPVLYMGEGQRTVTITLKTFPTSHQLAIDNTSIQVFFSGEEEWIEANNCEIKTNNIIEATLTPDQEAVVGYNKENLTEPFDTTYPVVKIVLTQKDPDPDGFFSLKNVKVKQATLKVDVEGVKNLILQNDQAVLDANKPFFPFGNRPHIGSSFYIGSWEVFQKELSNISLNFQWDNLPDNSGGFNKYYENYTDGANRVNEGFKVRMSLLNERAWQDVMADNSLKNLFTNEAGAAILNNQKLPGIDDFSLIKVIPPGEANAIPADIEMKPFTERTNETRRGFLRLTLNQQDFGHAAFATSYSEKAIDLAKWELETSNLAVEDDSPGIASALMTEIDFKNELINKGIELNYQVIVQYLTRPQLPNAPYTPAIKDLSINYTSEAVLNLTQSKNPATTIPDKGGVEFFHVHPFGVQKQTATSKKRFLLPQLNNELLSHYSNEGNLFIGLTDLMPPQTLSILFQHAEGSADPDANKEEVTWRYLKKDGFWGVLELDTHILSDGTNGLLTSGIIQFDIPDDISKSNTLLPDGKYWLWASVPQDSDAICDLIDVQAQAVAASFTDQGNDPDHLRDTLPAETISKLLVSDSAIDKIIQPFASFGGQIKEQRPEFYTRVSERLRHKQRAITIWDYERLILQQFSDVYKVKCINHTRFVDSKDFTDYSEMIPGHVTLIIVSNVFNKNAVDPLRPKTSLARLEEIADFIDSIKPPCVTTHIKNPMYEEIEVDFNVKFNKGIDAGLFKAKLIKEIKDFLSPWASDCPEEVRFGGRIHKSMILNFVEERSYVDYVTCFKMKHIVPFDEEHNDNEDVDEAVATRSVSILGSADNHSIHTILPGEEVCQCDDNIVLNSKQLASVDECHQIISDPGADDAEDALEDLPVFK